MMGSDYTGNLHSIEHKYFLYGSRTVLKLCLLPRKCELSGRDLWFKKARVARRVYEGPGGTVVENKWYDETELVTFMLEHGLSV
jgi:hypothetical protein